MREMKRRETDAVNNKEMAIASILLTLGNRIS